MKNKKIQLVVIIIVSFVLGFAGGMLFGGGNKNPEQSAYQMNGGSGFARGNVGTGTQARGFQRGAGMISGEVAAKDATSITVKIPNGGSKIVFFSASTTITKSTEGLSDDIVVGAPVTIAGTQNSDGSVSAQLIQLRSEVRMMQPGQ
jgi:hypothetical protein